MRRPPDEKGFSLVSLIISIAIGATLVSFAFRLTHILQQGVTSIALVEELSAIKHTLAHRLDCQATFARAGIDSCSDSLGHICSPNANNIDEFVLRVNDPLTPPPVMSLNDPSKNRWIVYGCCQDEQIRFWFKASDQAVGNGARKDQFTNKDYSGESPLFGEGVGFCGNAQSSEGSFSCHTGSLSDGGSLSSQDLNTGAFTNTANSITCNPGYTLMGCAGANHTTQNPYDNDITITSTTCTHEGSDYTLYATCCGWQEP